MYPSWYHPDGYGVTLLDSRSKVCLWRCVACDSTARGAAEPPACACGIERGWLLDTPDRELDQGASVRADEVPAAPVPRLRTGSVELDRLLGGGVAEGSSVLVYGRQGTGKSRLCYRWAAAHRCLLAHAEMAREVTRAIVVSTGAELSRVYLLRTLDGWQAEAERVGARAVVLDSLAAAGDAVAEIRGARDWAERRRAVVYCIAHQTKAGEHRGSSELAHWADYEWRLRPDPGGAVVQVVKARLEPGGAVVIPLAAG